MGVAQQSNSSNFGNVVVSGVSAPTVSKAAPLIQARTAPAPAPASTSNNYSGGEPGNGFFSLTEVAIQQPVAQAPVPPIPAAKPYRSLPPVQNLQNFAKKSHRKPPSTTSSQSSAYSFPISSHDPNQITATIARVANSSNSNDTASVHSSGSTTSSNRRQQRHASVPPIRPPSRGSMKSTQNNFKPSDDQVSERMTTMSKSSLSSVPRSTLSSVASAKDLPPISPSSAASRSQKDTASVRSSSQYTYSDISSAYYLGSYMTGTSVSSQKLRTLEEVLRQEREARKNVQRDLEMMRKKQEALLAKLLPHEREMVMESLRSSGINLNPEDNQNGPTNSVLSIDNLIRHNQQLTQPTPSTTTEYQPPVPAPTPASVHEESMKANSEHVLKLNELEALQKVISDAIKNGDTSSQSLPIHTLPNGAIVIDPTVLSSIGSTRSRHLRSGSFSSGQMPVH